jgi:hypothetical protein
MAQLVAQEVIERNPQAASGWQAGWMDHTQQPIVALAPAPQADESGLLLAASLGEGILRSTDYGAGWALENFGLADFRILSLAWAPPADAGTWPQREIAFAGGEFGLFRSPAAGLAWRPCDGVVGAVHTVVVAHSFRAGGPVLAASSLGGPDDEQAPPVILWRSVDGGRSFAATEAPPGIEFLLAAADGFVAATPDGLFVSEDGLVWHAHASSTPGALCLLATASGLLAGTADGVTLLP